MAGTQNMAVEALLQRHLGPVAAPRELWTRVQSPLERRRPQTVTRRLAWALAALVVFAGAASNFRASQSLAASRAAALQALTRAPGNLDFQSAKATEIRAWVRTQTGMDLPLSETSAPAVRLLGARHAPAGTVEVAYTVGDRRAALVVSKASPAFFEGDRHRKLNRESLETARTYSWTLGSRRYTLACSAPGELEAACSLCHVDSNGGRL